MCSLSRKTQSIITITGINIALGVAIVSIMKLHNFNLKQDWWIALFLYLPPLLIPNLMEWYVKLSAWVLAKRTLVAAVVLLVSLFLGFIFLIQSGYSINRTIEFPINSIRELVIGVLVGAGMRLLMTLIGFNLLFKVDLQLEKAMLLAGYCVALLLFPYSAGHEKSSTNQYIAGIYIIGIGIGFFLQFLMRTSTHVRAERIRMRYRIETLLGSNQGELRYIEGVAVKCLIRRQFKALKKLIEKQGKDHFGNMSIIEACMRRIKGDYSGCVEIVDKALKIADIPENIEAALTLLKALALGDEGKKEDEMWKILDTARRAYPKCPLIPATRALRLAEKFSTKKGTTFVEKAEPLSEMHESLALNKIQDQPIIHKTIGHSIPVTLAFYLDAYAYALLISDNFQLSRSLLIQCIRDDPSYPSTYLHLGEWYLKHYELLSVSRNQEEAKKLLGPAEYCLLIAKYLQRFDSRIRRRSKELLDTFFVSDKSPEGGI